MTEILVSTLMVVFVLCLLLAVILRRKRFTREKFWLFIAVWARANAFAARERRERLSSGLQEAFSEFGV